MKNRDILDSLNEIDPKMIADAAPGQNRGRKPRLWIRFTAIAACAALLAVSIPVGMLLRKEDNPPMIGNTTGGTAGGTQKHPPEVGETNANGPAATDSTAPGAGAPGTTATGSATPGTTEPGTSAPGAAEPGTTAPNATEPAPSIGEITAPDLNYLTARIFNPNRAAGEVSDEFRSAYADFALKLLTACRADQGSDTMISPLSLMTALAMTANGAGGNTLAQMETLLGGQIDIEALNQQIFNFYASLSSTESASFKAANSIWVTTQPHFSISPDFLEMMENTYNADVIGIDFADGQNAADAINAWCNYNTDGMIDQIAKKDSFDELTVMALLNALTFDAKWASPYDSKYQCSEGVFHGTKGDTTVTMMSDTLHGIFLKGERETGFIKYYKGGDYAFVALLPNEEGDISEYLATLSGSYLLDLIGNPDDNWEDYKLHTVLPAFKQETTVNLNDILKSLGMTDAFDSAAADLSGLGHSDAGNISIDKVAQKTFIEVNNEGTRAAAVTTVTAYPETDPPRHEYVTLDRPFVYAIIDTATSLPIFIGSCENIA